MNDVPKPPCILLVDNDAEFLRAEEVSFAERGYDVLVAETEQQAEALFAGNEVDLVVLDLMLEHKDAGIVLAHHFKKEKDVPILMVSDLTGETGMVFNLASAGERKWIKVDRILPKPVRLEHLAFEAETLLGDKSLRTTHNGFHHDGPQRLEL